MAQENMNNFIPKNAVKLCNRCSKRATGKIACEMYPQRIPHEVLVSKDCKGFLEKLQ